jgi:phage gpG-like protein
MATIAVITPDLTPIIESVSRAQTLLGSPTPLLKAWGAVVRGWIGVTFREEGRPKWKPLTDWTLAGRRQGKGGGSGKILQNNGKLATSFTEALAPTQVTIFSNLPTALWHQYGTLTYLGKAPKRIYPKNGKALALPFIGMRGDGSKRIAGQYTLAGLGRSKALPNGSYQVTKPGRSASARVTARAGKAITPYAHSQFFGSVLSKGVPPRPMLPTDAQIVPRLNEEAARLISLALRSKGFTAT